MLLPLGVVWFKQVVRLLIMCVCMGGYGVMFISAWPDVWQESLNKERERERKR